MNLFLLTVSLKLEWSRVRTNSFDSLSEAEITYEAMAGIAKRKKRAIETLDAIVVALSVSTFSLSS